MKKMLLFLTLANLIYSDEAYSQSFNYLKEIDLGYAVSILYDDNLTELIQKTDPETGAIEVLKTKISRFAHLDYIVEFDPGPSEDPSFTFYCLENNDKKPIITIPGERLIIPGNGNVYVSGRSNNMFLKRQKFKLSNNMLEEVEQPAYYVGLKTKVLKTIELFADIEQTKRVAVLPKNHEVEVILNQGEYYLLKTPFGLLGWIRIGSFDITEPILEGIFYAGD